MGVNKLYNRQNKLVTCIFILCFHGEKNEINICRQNRSAGLLIAYNEGRSFKRASLDTCTISMLRGPLQGRGVLDLQVWTLMYVNISYYVISDMNL